MTFDGEVIAAETTGDGAKITVQVRGVTWAAWRSMERLTVVVRAHEAAGFPIGRRVRVSVTPRP